MKIGVRVDNRCLSCFMVETSGYESPRTNQGNLKRTLVFEETGPGQWASTGPPTVRVWTDRASIPLFSHT